MFRLNESINRARRKVNIKIEKTWRNQQKERCAQTSAENFDKLNKSFLLILYCISSKKVLSSLMIKNRKMENGRVFDWNND